MAAPMLQIKARQPAAWVALYQSETYFKIFNVKVGVVFPVAPTCSTTVCLFCLNGMEISEFSEYRESDL